MSGYPVESLGSIYVTFNTQSSRSEAVTLLSGAHLFAALYISIVWMIKTSGTTETMGPFFFFGRGGDFMRFDRTRRYWKIDPSRNKQNR